MLRGFVSDSQSAFEPAKFLLALTCDSSHWKCRSRTDGCGPDSFCLIIKQLWDLQVELHLQPYLQQERRNDSLCSL